MMRVKLIEILRPSFPVVILTIVLLLLSLIIIVTSEATSKVSWNHYRGAPLKAMVTLRYTGPCSDVVPCTRITFGEIYPVAFLADLIFWYLISALLFFGLKNMRAVMRI
jgi:hypothetical protein